MAWPLPSPEAANTGGHEGNAMQIQTTESDLKRSEREVLHAPAWEKAEMETRYLRYWLERYTNEKKLNERDENGLLVEMVYQASARLTELKRHLQSKL